MGILDRFIKPRVDAAVCSALAVVENENTFLIGTRSGTQGDRDRYTYDRSEVLEQSLTAWRTNQLARRIIELTSQYVVGGGLSVNCEHEPAAAFLRQFWKHRLNRMDTRVIEMRDELSRSGNLFVLLSTDPAGMSYIRLLPASDIEEIKAAANDIKQPIAFKIKSSREDLSPKPGSILVADENGIIVIMNAESRGRPEMQVGFDLIGHSAITCHKEPTQSKVRKIYEEQQFNIYSIKLGGKKQLVYQAPYFISGKFSGIVEMVLDLPDDMPHFDRDAEKAAKENSSN